MGVPGFASNRFEILRQLGEGGMGVVYEALDRERGTRVALKTLRNASPDHLLRLKREFRVMQEVHHPNIVAPRELVCEQGQWLMTMDLVEGDDFVTYCRALCLAAPGAVVAPERGHLVETAPTLPLVRIPDAPLFDEARLRSTASQLAEGLIALHAAGIVHRDVKPSNVLVTRTGTVVLLDFGLVAELRADAATLAVVGTPHYMAPEQAASGEVGPEADWYSVGVLLYVVLTGRVPFDGPALQVMLRKQSEQPLPPSSLAPGVPPDLEALCVALLRFEPAERPTGSAVLRQLGATPAPTGAAASISRTPTPPFVGRQPELRALERALHDSRAECVAVTVEGESGLGKSRLVRRFSQRLVLEDATTVVLMGRCLQSESVPYKAFDGIVDALASLLARLPDADARELLPTRVAPLAQVFPVLRRVPAVADRVRAAASVEVEPFEIRNRAFAALREMLTRLGDRRPLVVVVDDAQWADHDSLALMSEVTRRPDAPRMLLVATVRTPSTPSDRAASGAEVAADRIAHAAGVPVRRIPLGPLAADEARELVATLADRAQRDVVSAAQIDAIVSESKGHPLFLEVLARQGEWPREQAHGGALLDEAIATQLAALDADARAVVDAVIVAGEPLAQRVVERATGLTPDRFVRAAQRLRVARLVATTGTRADDRIEPYHDRLRAAIHRKLPRERRIALHRQLARALEAERDASPEALALHWWEAGEADQAARYSVVAGDRAAAAMAFDRAATFYDQALLLFGDSGEDVKPEKAANRNRLALLVKMGEALANAGRGKRAAEAFQQAARRAPAAQALDLRRRAADQLLRCGHFDEGVSELEGVLASVGVQLPRTPLGAIVYFVFFRLLVFVRGLRYRSRDASQMSAEALVRADACWSAAFSLGMTDWIRGAALQARTLAMALRLGEPYRVALALSIESTYCATHGGRAARRVARIASMARAAAEASQEPHARAWAVGGPGAAAYLLGRWRAALEELDRSRELFAECAGAAWEVATMSIFAVNCLAQLGDLRALVQRTSSYLRQATDRGDLYAAVNLRIGFANLRWLVPDDPEAACAQIDQAMAAWSLRGFHLEHFYELLARTNLDLYRGRAREAYRRAVETWPLLRRSRLSPTIRSLHVLALDLRARAALACAAGGGERTAALLHMAQRDARRIERVVMPSAMPLATMLRAAVACVRARGASEPRRSAQAARAAELLREAVAGFDAAGMKLHAHVGRRALGALVGGDQGRALVDEAGAWFGEQTVKRADRFCAMLAPVLVTAER